MGLMICAQQLILVSTVEMAGRSSAGRALEPMEAPRLKYSWPNELIVLLGKDSRQPRYSLFQKTLMICQNIQSFGGHG